MNESHIAIRNDKINYLWLAVVVLLSATLLRSFDVGAQSLTFDESDRVLLARLPWAQSWIGVAQEGLHALPMLVLVLKFFVEPLNETWIRLPSVLFGIVTIALMSSLARSWFGRWAGWAVLCLFALNPFHIWFSRTATMYSVMLFSVAGSFWAFHKVLRSVRAPLWILMSLFTSAGILTHHFALIAPFVQFAYLVATLKQNHKVIVGWMLAQGLAATPLLIWLGWSITQQKVYYIGTAASRSPNLLDVFQTLWNYSFVYTGEVTPLIIVSLILFLSLFAFGFYIAWREARLLVWWFALPLATAFVFSFRLPMYIDRYLSPIMLALVLVLVLGVARLRWRNGLLAALLCISAFNISRIYYDQNFFAKEGWRESITYLQSREREGDVIVAPHFEQFLPFFLYYQGKLPFKGITAGQNKIFKIDDLKGGATRLWLFTPHYQDSTHLLAACPPFDQVTQAVTKDHADWVIANASKMLERIDYPCITIFLYDFGR